MATFEEIVEVDRKLTKKKSMGIYKISLLLHFHRTLKIALKRKQLSRIVESHA